MGVVGMELFHPGSGLSPEVRARLLESYQHGVTETKAG